MKIALCFFGITRSLKYTVESIQLKVLNVLKANHIEYDIFMHTYKLDNYTNIRTKEKMETMDNKEYKLLNPDYFEMDDQDEMKKKINMSQYRSKPDPWNTQYNSVDNFILGQYSKSRIVAMIDETKFQYDYVIYIRPDCLYIDPFNLDFLKHATNKAICIPNFHLFGKYNFNDRFSITNMTTYKAYGNLFHDMLRISKIQSLHAETILGERIDNHHLDVVRIPFRFSRVRCNGVAVDKF